MLLYLWTKTQFKKNVLPKPQNYSILLILYNIIEFDLGKNILKNVGVAIFSYKTS